MLDIARLEEGSIVTNDLIDYVVVSREGKKRLERFGTSTEWHTNVQDITAKNFQEFVQEFVEEFDSQFPHSRLNILEKLELAIALWLKFQRVSSSL